MRTTITLSKDVYEAARTLSLGSGKSLGEVISDLARRGLRPQPQRGKGLLPRFSVPDHAEVIPGSRVRELLAEEDAT